MGNSSSLGSLAVKAIAALIIVAVAIFLFGVIFSAIAGFIKLLLTIGLILVVGYAVLWAIRKL
jgi:hypothetical protein